MYMQLPKVCYLGVWPRCLELSLEIVKRHQFCLFSMSLIFWIVYISLMFLNKVVRLCAKSREAVSSPVEHLTLHYQVCSHVAIYLLYFRLYQQCVKIVSLQVRHLDTSEKSELHKLQQLKDEQGQNFPRLTSLASLLSVMASIFLLGFFRNDFLKSSQ